MQKETVIRDTHEHDANEALRHNSQQDDKPTECGLTREELRAIVAEMIG